MRGEQAAVRFLEYNWTKCLDIGAGVGAFASFAAGRDVISLDIRPQSTDCLEGDYLYWRAPENLEAIWCCHVLEHQRNPGLFLDKIYNDLPEGGVLCITVPPAKHAIVGGHVTLWNAGLLIYNLVLAKFDCTNARVGVEGYNISVIVRKKTAKLPALARDAGDITLLRDFWPCEFSEGQSGQLENIGW